MKRHAILIASPKLKNHTDLPGTLVDVRRMREWMLSNRGGAWEPEEIQTFTNPSHDELKPYLQHQTKCDYVFNLFAGHGYTVPGEYTPDTVACLRDGEDLPVRMLNPGNRRCSIFSDCCRHFHVDLPPELIVEKRAEERYAAKAMDERARMRELFDRHVMACDEGAVYFYSCAKNQGAGDDNDEGGIFTYFFVKSANEWASYQPSNAVMPINRTFEAAKDRTTRLAPQQTPEMGGVRRMTFFPFAVT
jgi:hypothetical protein